MTDATGNSWFTQWDRVLLLTRLLLVTAVPSPAAIRYVRQANPNPIAPYSRWDTAATNLQDAVDAAQVGDLILVTNGVYATGGRAVYGMMTNRVVIDKAVTVQSVNGPGETLIVGAPAPGATNNGDGAIRCAYVGTNAVLSGFTLTNGHTRTTGDINNEARGGGAWCESSGLLSNCTLTGNAARHGGGAYSGTLNHCTLTSNSAYDDGGGTYLGTLNHCTLIGNSAALNGGGNASGTLNDCVLIGNWSVRGGGARSSTLNRCTLTGNSASFGGGVYYSTLNNCLLTGNSATNTGGGAYGWMLKNCSLTGNGAGVSGGGISSFGLYSNCIIYYNTAPTGSNYSGAGIYYSCTAPLPPGAGNLTNEPRLIDGGGGDLRLRDDSPCLDAGADLGGSLTNDLAGNPRPLDGNRDGLARYDLGAYEYTGLNTLAATAIAPSSATLEATVHGFGLAAVAWFEWGRTAEYGYATPTMNVGPGTNLLSLSHTLTDLTPSAIYYYRLVVAGNPGKLVGNPQTVTLPPLAFIQTLPASHVEQYSATLPGTVNPLGCESAAWFEWGTSTNYGFATPAVGVGGGTHDLAFAAVITNLQAGTTHYYRLVVSNRFGQSPGNALSFVTPISRFVWLDSPQPTPPFTTWGTAAHTLQEAVDASLDGDLVLVTNGLYALGGRAVVGQMTNRVALNKAITMQSMNGAAATWIMGTAAAGGGPGDGAVRCAYVGAKAILTGFTLTNGHTRADGEYEELAGGGAWCEVGGALNHCLLTGNAACFDGGGVYSGALNYCTLTGNAAGFDGGGAYDSKLDHCALSNNSAGCGGGASLGTLIRCLVTDNQANMGGGASYNTLIYCTVAGNVAAEGGGAYRSLITNGIVYDNSASRGSNYVGSTFDYSCTAPLPAGRGNIAREPAFLDQGNGNFLLRYNSPCLDAGVAVSGGYSDPAVNPPPLDGNLDGQAAFDMGAYEFDPRSLVAPEWWDQHGLDPADPHILTNDPDGDGQTTFQEWLAGTDPTKALSRFRLEAVAQRSAVALSFASLTNRVYLLQVCTNLAQPVWTVLPGCGDIPGTGGLQTLTDPTAGPRRYYRLGIRLP